MSANLRIIDTKLPALNVSERVLACCMIAREKIEMGDYEAASASLQEWWSLGTWPIQTGMTTYAVAELLFTAGTLSGLILSTRQSSAGQKPAEALLNGAIALFQQLGDRNRVAETKVELACSYFWQGFYELARDTVRPAIEEISEDDHELMSVALIRLALIEHHAGRLHDALGLLNRAEPLIPPNRTWIKGRFHVEFATTLKDLGIADQKRSYLERSLGHYEQALKQFETIGNRRYVAIVENNWGYLLLSLGRFDEAAGHLQRASSLFEEFGDQVRRAQVDETIAQLYLGSERYDLAEKSIKQAVSTFEGSSEEALLAEALTTQGIVLCRLSRRHEAKPIIERARRVAERCGDRESAGRALLIMIEEMCDQLADDERREIGAQANQLLANSQQAATRERLRNCLHLIAEAHKNHEAQREQEIHAQKMAALGELSFGVAHNVNNTLTGILGRAQLLLRNSSDPAKLEAGIEMIIKSAEDGAHIIRRIQDFARQRPSREFEVVSIADLLKDACEMTRPRWESRSEFAPIRFVLHADCKAHVKGDPVELREVLVNMIYNAVDAMPSGGEVRVSIQETRDRAVVSIADTGTGMTMETKQRLFDPFFTTKGKAGTGMGLAVSFGIIRRHEGAIDVESEQGRGTTFRISLPKVELAVERNTGTLIMPQEEPQDQGKVRVLVVDDEEHVREVLIEALESEGCQVLSAQSGEIALALFDQYQGKFDAVFTDIGMPDMSGWELVTEIRERSKNVPLAIISGWADAISVETKNEVQANWIVPKPFDINKICDIAQEIAQLKLTAV
jgi:signal transduction histidine kinase/ActR/RegA family two-component response regulator/predicted negative regulator of RcsB-dependent stress response